MKERLISIVDRVTPTARLAWIAEHEARVLGANGNTIMARHYAEEGVRLRHEDIHNKIVFLFDRSDAQNAVIDVGLKLKQPLPILEGVA